ncbi:MAG TPA: ABC transporter permease [Vicinamibacteria bacterium]|nr:ABC transporter permease [Vicinamibacteria bacterium]
MDTFLQDLKHGLRLLARRPGFTAVAVVSLALGVGLNTTLFSVVNAVLLRGTPVQKPERLVEIYSSVNEDFPYLTTSYPDYLSIRAQGDAFSGVAAHAFVRGILATGDKPALVTGETITPNYFDVLGLRPALGRGFREDENVAEGQQPVVILGHGLWQRRFGGRADIVGQAVELSGIQYTVVGVGPVGFAGMLPGLESQFWVPVMMIDRLNFSGIQSATDHDPGATRVQRRGQRWLFVKGRLADGKTVAQARAQVDTIFARLRKDDPLTNDKVRATVLPLAGVRFHPMVDGYVKAASAVLLAAVALVLAVACANVANMLLARGASRRRELAVRAAIGAGRGRLARQLLSESLVLAAMGGAAGVVLAVWAGRILTQVPMDWLPVPVHFDFQVDGTVLAFAALVSLATTMVFGLAPAHVVSKLDLVASLKADATGEGSVRRRVSLRDTLVVTQLALSLVLLVAGTLLARGLLAARGMNLGFDPAPLSFVQFNLQMNGYDVPRAMALRGRVLAQVRALPGVTAAALVSRLPLAPDINMEGVQIRGQHRPQDEATQIDSVSVGDDYFRTAGVPILEGRPITADDVEGSRRVLVINETMARRFWPGRSAIGQLVYTQGFEAPPHEVVGVARDHRVRSVGEEPRPYLHFPTAPSREVSLAVRTAIPPEKALPMLRAAILALEPDIVFTDAEPATEVVATTLAPTRIGAALLGAFGGLAMLLAAVGLYGVIAYSVSMRTREMGVRMALGARPADVLGLVLGQAGRLWLAGIAVGAILGALVGRVLASMLYWMSAVDPVAYAVAATLLLVVAALASLAPALQAARVDPLRALRSE